MIDPGGPDARRRGASARRRPARGSPFRRRPQEPLQRAVPVSGQAPGRYANVQLHPSARITTGIVIYRLDDRLFFANARYVKARVLEAVRGAPEPARRLIFDAESVTDVDATGPAELAELKAALARDDVELLVARMKPHVHERLTADGLAENIGEDRFFPTVRSAVASSHATIHHSQGANHDR